MGHAREAKNFEVPYLTQKLSDLKIQKLGKQDTYHTNHLRTLEQVVIQRNAGKNYFMVTG